MNIQFQLYDNLSYKPLKSIYSQEIATLERGAYYPVIQWKMRRGAPDLYENRYIHVMPMYVFEELTPTITVDFLLEQLNNSACFDFEYSPQQHDYLQLFIGWQLNYKGIGIKHSEQSPILYFGYHRGQWYHEDLGAIYGEPLINQGILLLAAP